MAKILYVEDDLQLANAVKEWLEDFHTIELVDNAEDAIQLLTNFAYEIILLDWDLPGISGVDFCSSYRQSGGSAWVVFVTGRNDVLSIQEALNLGGDDYVTKPFDPRVLSAKLDASLRRIRLDYKPELSIGDVRLDSQSRTLFVGEKIIHLMPKESDLLEFLMRNVDIRFSSKDLLAAVWSSEREVSEGVVRTYVRQVRKKLELAGKFEFIDSVAARGYLISSKPS